MHPVLVSRPRLSKLTTVLVEVNVASSRNTVTRSLDGFGRLAAGVIEAVKLGRIDDRVPLAERLVAQFSSPAAVDCAVKAIHLAVGPVHPVLAADLLLLLLGR